MPAPSCYGGTLFADCRDMALNAKDSVILAFYRHRSAIGGDDEHIDAVVVQVRG
jgi:hypothetical protein